MILLIWRPIEIYREEGVRPLWRKTTRLLHERSQDAYWRLRGTRTVTRGDVTATFPTATMSQARALRRLLWLESPMLEDLLSELRSDDIFYDIGAHIGVYTCFAVNALPDENVVAFEPNPANLEKLQRNLVYNGSPRIREVVLSNEEGFVEFDNPTLRRNEWGGKGSIAPEAGEESITVKARTGDTLVERSELPLPTVVKMDVEGAEALVIEGMADALAHDNCRLVYCEVHHEAHGRRSVESYGSTPIEVEQMLESLGFTTERLDNRPAEFFLKGTKEDD
jgi:FkbM family methyltransferase